MVKYSKFNRWIEKSLPYLTTLSSILNLVGIFILISTVASRISVNTASYIYDYTLFFFGLQVIRLLLIGWIHWIKKHLESYFFLLCFYVSTFLVVLHLFPHAVFLYSSLAYLMMFIFYSFISWKDIKTILNYLRLDFSKYFSIGFITIIFLGSWLLSLSIANKQPISYVNALFTSTSAVTVTGLATIDITSQFTLFGQFIILILIELGGLGIISFSLTFILWTSQKLSYLDANQALRFFRANNISHLRKLLVFIFGFTFTIELIGAIGMFFTYPVNLPLGEKIFSSIFHSVSAFCNAGFSLFKQGLETFYANGSFLWIFMILITLGGLGFPVLFDIHQKKFSWKNLSPNSKIVLGMSSYLLISGAILFYILEYHNVLLDMPTIDKINNSFFQSITTRTAGFNTVDIPSLNPITSFVMISQMFIGASAGGTGGGLKTVTFFLFIWMIKNIILYNRMDIPLMHRSVKTDTLIHVGVILFLRLFIMIFAFFLLSITEENIDSNALIFEIVSAFSTVGLTMGITAKLTEVGKLIFISLMFIGRVGSFHILQSLFSKKLKYASKIYYEEINLSLE